MDKNVLAIRHVPHEGLGMISDAMREIGMQVTLLDAKSTEDFQFNPEHWAGLVILGGPMNADETSKYPFLGRELKWIQMAIENELPVLGVCLGSQLIAKALGAKVYPNAVKEIGWYPLHVTPAADNDRLFSTLEPEETVFQWHGDTFDLPEGAVHLASSPACVNQAFRYGPSTYALQFHVEVTPDIINDWLDEDVNCSELSGLPYIDPQVICQQTPKQIARLNEIGSNVLGQFAAMCADQARLS